LEYFEELVHSYDRVCVSDIAFASTEERRIIMAHLTKFIKDKNLDTFIHWLGVSPSDETYYNMIGSSDSSSWATPFRYGYGEKSVSNVKGTNYMKDYYFPIGTDAETRFCLIMETFLNSQNTLTLRNSFSDKGL